MTKYTPSAFGDSGVYKIQIGPTFYIGSCNQFGKRLAGHKSDLFAGTHPNKKLQEAWDIHKQIECFILKNVPRKAHDVESDKDHLARLKFHEQLALDAEFNHPDCANSSSNSRYNSAAADHMRAKWNDPAWRESTSAKIREAARNRQISDDTRRKMAEAKRGGRNHKSRPCVIHHGGKSIRFDCTSEAARHFNATQQAMDAWLKGAIPWPGTGPRKPKRADLIGMTGEFVE